MDTEIELTPVVCAECGVVFALPKSFNESLKKTGQGFHCPNGHSLSYGKGENQKLKDKLADSTRQTDYQTDLIREREKEISNKKSQITRLKKKVMK